MTKEEAIARIKNHKIAHKMNEPRAIYISEALDMAVKALEQESKWIPVSERLPNDEEYVLVCYEDGHIRTAYYYIDPNIYPSEFEDCCETGWYNYNEDFMLYQDVIAWMPLPKPYEPKERSDKE